MGVGGETRTPGISTLSSRRSGSCGLAGAGHLLALFLPQTTADCQESHQPSVSHAHTTGAQIRTNVRSHHRQKNRPCTMWLRTGPSRTRAGTWSSACWPDRTRIGQVHTEHISANHEKANPQLPLALPSLKENVVWLRAAPWNRGGRRRCRADKARIVPRTWTYPQGNVRRRLPNKKQFVRLKKNKKQRMRVKDATVVVGHVGSQGGAHDVDHLLHGNLEVTGPSDSGTGNIQYSRPMA